MSEGKVFVYNCVQCGIRFERKYGHKYKFCSRECFYNNRRDFPLTKKSAKPLNACVICRKKTTNKSFCSHECENNISKNPEFLKKISQMRMRTRKINNMLLYKKSPQTTEQMDKLIENNEYGDMFTKELREQIREKFNRCCFFCGKSEEEYGKRMDVHHVDSNKKNNSVNNLVPLCYPCHTRVTFPRSKRIRWMKILKEMIEDFVRGVNVDRCPQ